MIEQPAASQSVRQPSSYKFQKKATRRDAEGGKEEKVWQRQKEEASNTKLVPKFKFSRQLPDQNMVGRPMAGY